MAIIHAIKCGDQTLEVRDHHEYRELLFFGITAPYVPEINQSSVVVDVNKAKQLRDVLNKFIQEQEEA